MHKLSLKDDRRPGGPDGQGWNRLALMTLAPTVRCTLKPRTRQAALDTARGMRLPELAVWYDLCRQPSDPCSKCPLAIQDRVTWQPDWSVRECADGTISLAGATKGNHSGELKLFANWAALLQQVDVPPLRRRPTAPGGFEWISADS